MPSVILMTGITGFVGGAAGVELLTRHPRTELLALVRGQSFAEASKRVERSLSRFTDANRLPSLLARTRVLLGDITDPRSLESFDLDRVTEVLHLAANTSLRSLRGVRQVNILGTMALLHRMRSAPRLRRFLHVGTAYICGANPGRIVAEDDHPRWDVQHLVEYTRSKAECELLIGAAATDLPVVVARPSIIVGHTLLGCAPSASIFWYYRLADRLGLIPTSPDARKDIVPVDHVATALVELLTKPTLLHRRYHVSAGVGSAVSWRDMQLAFARADCRPPGPPYEQIPVEEILLQRGRIEQAIGPGDAGRVLSALEPFYRLSASGAEVFDNARLLGEGLPPPPPFTRYLDHCVDSTSGRSLYEQLFDDE